MTQNPDSKSNSYPPRDAVEKRAREIWEQRGRPEGQELDHWYQAESELLEMRNKAEKIDPAVKPAPSGNPATGAAQPAAAGAKPAGAPSTAPASPKPAAGATQPAGSAAKPVTPVPKPSGSNQPVAPSPKPPAPPKKK